MFRIGREEIAEITMVIENKDLFKINNGLQESKQVEEKLKNIFGSFRRRDRIDAVMS